MSGWVDIIRKTLAWLSGAAMPDTHGSAAITVADTTTATLAVTDTTTAVIATQETTTATISVTQ